MKRMENIEGEYNFQFQEFLPIPSSSMDKLSIKERIIIEVCDFLETWCWFYLHLDWTEVRFKEIFY
ncbi:hypothetical protein RO1_28890 [Roseburia intestinalis XB6B4]|uniref:Uncharacterized protein n=1 Tax=Roseburia intestinalis XB6B4 TaxID=718255 RepID=D4L0Z1_9FIRM|nr:hypothetical protein RO1_28890 [Roseburia intestinalis XB6B4]